MPLSDGAELPLLPLPLLLLLLLPRLLAVVDWAALEDVLAVETKRR